MTHPNYKGEDYMSKQAEKEVTMPPALLYGIIIAVALNTFAVSKALWG